MRENHAKIFKEKKAAWSREKRFHLSIKETSAQEIGKFGILPLLIQRLFGRAFSKKSKKNSLSLSLFQIPEPQRRNTLWFLSLALNKFTKTQMVPKVPSMSLGNELTLKISMLPFGTPMSKYRAIPQEEELKMIEMEIDYNTNNKSALHVMHRLSNLQAAIAKKQRLFEMVGNEQDVAVLVPDDIISIKFPIDARLLKIDQSTFTGESLTGLGDGVYFGFTCKQGEIEVVVITTRVYTFFGKAAHLVDTNNQVGCVQKALTAIENFCIYGSPSLKT
ncbi:hypothetical protein VNO77_37615 [Canavalia gladiata]|uniref:P-type ATPase A domain-containing protein n=1 Tax=Canavalia gladiata TaxID=3824 RepID=A0AAN9KB96_CANGL